MKGHYTYIFRRTDGNITAELVEWCLPDGRELELILTVDGDSFSIKPTDCPRLARLMSNALDRVVERVEEEPQETFNA